MIKEEVQLFTEEIRKSKGEPLNFTNKFNLLILNALWNVTVGQRFDYDDPKLISLIEQMTNWMKRVTNAAAVLVFVIPTLFKIFPKFLDYNQTLDTSHEISDMMKETIRRHEESIDPNEPRDFTDKALIEIRGTTDRASSFFGEKGQANLANTLYDLFLAGSETTSTTLTWALLFVACYPRVQRKVQEEMETVVGIGLAPSLQRYANILPNGANHSSSKDIVVNEMVIPAGTLFIPLMMEIHKGPYWGDGEVFRPDSLIQLAAAKRTIT